MKNRLPGAPGIALLALVLGGAVAATRQPGVAEDPYVSSDVMIRCGTA